MIQKQPRRSDQEWLDLIQECRASGLPDKTWCDQHNIACSGLYYHIKRLRNKACKIPAPSKSSLPTMQEVVPLKIHEEYLNSAPNTDSTLQLPEVAVRLNYQGITIEITNHAVQQTIVNTITALRSLC